MKPPADKEPFFIGWAAMPRQLRGLFMGIAVGLVALAGLAAYMLAATQDDPGSGAYLGSVKATGILESAPYPVLHVTQSPNFPAGTTLMLYGQTKVGVQPFADPLNNRLVNVEGVSLSRGDLAGMVLNRLTPAEGNGIAPQPRDLGRWRLTGEICDGKCFSGAMRPGQGLAHKACANLCLLGGLAPVFVATDKVDGAEFFLMGSPAGGALDDTILNHTAQLIQIDGRIEARGSLKVFLADPDTIKIVD